MDPLKETPNPKHPKPRVSARQEARRVDVLNHKFLGPLLGRPGSA